MNSVLQLAQVSSSATFFQTVVKALALGSVYILIALGFVIIFKASPTFEQVAANSIGNEESNSSIIVVDGEIFLRTHKALWKIGRGKVTVMLK